MQTKQLFDFATTIEALKKIERFKGQYYWKDYPQPHHYESVAEHMAFSKKYVYKYTRFDKTIDKFSKFIFRKMKQEFKLFKTHA